VLRKSLATTNPIESTFSTVRRISRRVTRWQSGTMALRWALAGTREAEKTWRRLIHRAAPLRPLAHDDILDESRCGVVGFTRAYYRHMRTVDRGSLRSALALVERSR
jgi:hypothetical protein